MNNRLAYIDIAKGILILFVMLGHIPLCCDQIGVSSGAIHSLYELRPLYAPYYMAAFFVVSGFCSDFNISRKKFYLKLLTKLLIPSFVCALIVKVLYFFVVGNFSLLFEWIYALAYCGPLWFVTVLFVDKVILYELLQIFSESKILVFSIASSIIGIVLFDMDFFPNYLVHRHSFYFLLFLFLGHIIKRSQDNFVKYCKWLSLAYIVGVFMFQLLNYELPSLSGGLIKFHVSGILVSWIFAILGTALVMFVSLLMKKNRFLEAIGRNSLYFYVIHDFVITFICSFYYSHVWFPQSRIQAIPFSIQLIAVSSVVCLFIIFVFRYFLTKLPQIRNYRYFMSI